MNTPTQQPQPIDTGISAVQPAAGASFPKAPRFTFLTNIMAKIPQPVKDIFARFSKSGFYSNKKIFWLVTGAFGLIFLTVLVGVLFGSRGQNKTGARATPTPQASTAPEASPSGDIISVTEGQLKSLNGQINSLDVRQSRLSPPVINYDINF